VGVHRETRGRRPLARRSTQLPTEKGESYETGDGIAGELRSYRPGDRVRLTYGTTTLQVAVSASVSGSGSASALALESESESESEEKTVLRFHQEHLAHAVERERQRAHWKAVMADVVQALGVARQVAS
jgi:hypothetical protein